jgi:hypothetical protein
MMALPAADAQRAQAALDRLNLDMAQEVARQIEALPLGIRAQPSRSDLGAEARLELHLHHWALRTESGSDPLARLEVELSWRWVPALSAGDGPAVPPMAVSRWRWEGPAQRLSTWTASDGHVLSVGLSDLVGLVSFSLAEAALMQVLPTLSPSPSIRYCGLNPVLDEPPRPFQPDNAGITQSAAAQATGLSWDSLLRGLGPTPRVDSRAPTLRWLVPDALQLGAGTAVPITQLRYDLRVWKAAPGESAWAALWSGASSTTRWLWPEPPVVELAYRRDGWAPPTAGPGAANPVAHPLEIPLQAGTVYQWTVRPRFRLDGAERVGAWSYAHLGTEKGAQACELPVPTERTAFRFITP